MAKVSENALQEVQAALEAYRREVYASALKESTKWTYMRHADTFVRWLNEDFVPGTLVEEKLRR